MIRITGGEWNGRKLWTPPGDATRPTAARVRQALFNVLSAEVRGATFYDLYAGSGAMGFEALSRGASRAVFVESSRRALEALRRNLGELQCEARAEAVPARLPGWFETAQFAPDEASILFLDPPYNEGLAHATLQALADCAGALCAAQTEKQAELAEAYGAWRLRKRYGHGDTALWLYGKAG